MRLNYILKTALIITLFLSCFNTYSQSSAPFINRLEGLNDGREAKIYLEDGIEGKDYLIQYRIKNTTNWFDSPLKIRKGTEAIITGLESNKNYCFRAFQRDSVTKIEIASNEVCSVNLKSTLLSETQVRFDWNKIDIRDIDKVGVNVVEENSKGEIKTYNLFLSSYSDTTALYTQLYCSATFKATMSINYSVPYNDSKRSVTVKSSQVLVDPKSLKLKPALSSIGVVSVSPDGLIKYNIFDITQGYGYEVYKSINGGELIKIGEGSKNVFEDTNVDAGNNYYCYAHKYVNGCDNESELSPRSCQVKVASKNYGKLSWSPFTIDADTNLLKKGKTEYMVQMVNQDGLVLNTISKTADTTVIIPIENYDMFNTSYRFRVLATIQGQLYYNGGFIPFPFFSYSNAVSITLPPFISQLEGLNGGKEAKISIENLVPGKEYIMQYRLKGAKDWVESPLKIKGVTDLGEAILTGLETSKSYCFRLIERNDASKTETISNEVCSVVLKSTLLSSKSVRLQWSMPDKADTGITTIVVMDENGNNVDSLEFGEISDTTFIHNELNCLTRFKYSIVSESINNRVIVKSSQILVDPKSLLTPPNLQSVDVVSVGTDNQPFYDTYLLAQMPKYEFYQSINGGEMIKVGEDKTASYSAKNLDTERNYYCFAHKYTNECGNTSELSRKTCTIRLSSGSMGKLTWLPFKVYTDTSLYKVAKTDYIVQVMDTLKNTIDYLDPVRDTTIIVEEKYGTSVKYKVRANVLGYINLGPEVRQHDISSYSNTVEPYLVLGNESSRINLTVYPNPAEDKVRISNAGTPAKFVELIDMRGHVIHRGEVADDSFDLSAFEKGKYILRLYDANKKLLNTKNIVKW